MITKYDQEMLGWHPEMVLVSRSPVIWRGFLIISNSLYTADNVQCPRMKLKLIVPNYPSLCDIQIIFGRQIVAIRNKTFRQKLKDLMKTEEINKLTVLSFLRQLQLLIGQYMYNESKKNYTIDLSMTDLLRDLKMALQNSSDVRISYNGSLSTIKLSLKGVSLVLQRNNSTEVPWQIVSSDLPNIRELEGFGKNITNLSIAVTKFKWQMELLEKTWEQLKEIDENCWVIEPLEPNKNHMYRRIHLSQLISITITIDPLHPTALPIIKFSGSDSEVKKQTDYISNNILNWDQDCSVLENLRMLLNMYVFPKQEESLEDDNAIVDGRECGICFSMESDANELPDKMCSNDRCMRHYHSACLSQWLQTKAENQVVFGHIHGICPHCKERISCPIK